MRRSRIPRPGTRRGARPAYVHFHVWSSSGLVRIGLFSLPSEGGTWGLKTARVRVRAPRCPNPAPFSNRKRTSTRDAPLRTPWAGFPVVCGQSDGFPRLPHNLYAALRRDYRQAGVKHACCPPRPGRASRAVPAKGSERGVFTHPLGRVPRHARRI